MVKRLFDILTAATAMLALSPVFLLAVVGIRLTSAGPVLYCAPRVGRHGQTFVMHKFRTMHTGSRAASAVTATVDPRVFPFGRVLRMLKIDELPQLFDVLIGHMSIVGPRPEDPEIVRKHYGDLGRETLSVAPGLASPGSLYNYTHGHLHLDDEAPERSYVTRLLPIKLAIELVYLRDASMFYDLQIILRTLTTILRIAAGQKSFSAPPELAEAEKFLADAEGLVRT